MNRNPLDPLKKIIIYTTVIGAIILSLLFFIINYTFAYIAVEKPDGIRDTRVSLSYNSYQKEIGKPGLHIVKRGADEISVWSGDNIHTSSPFKTPWYGFSYKKIKIQYDKNADKAAYQSMLDDACGTYSKNLATLLQYKCTAPRALTRFNTPDRGEWTTNSIYSEIYFANMSPKPYIGGLLGVDYDLHHPPSIVAIRDNGSTRKFNPPEGYRQDTFSSAKIFTDTHTTENNRFVIVESDGTIYLATPTSDDLSAIEYKKIETPKDYDINNSQTICDIKKTIVACYTGQTSTPKGAVSSKPTRSYITIMNFENNDRREIKLQDNLILQNFVITTDSRMFGSNRGELLYFKQDRSGDKALGIKMSKEISAISADDDIYFIKNNGIYKASTTTFESYRVFYSPSIQPVKLMTVDKKVFTIGKSTFIKNYTYAWQLNNQDNTTNSPRAIDLLPSVPESSTYGTTDLSGDKLYIVTPLTRSSSNKDTERIKRNTLDYLKLIGVNTDEFTIVYPYDK